MNSIEHLCIFSLPQDSLSNFLDLQVHGQFFNLFGPCRLSMLLVCQAVVLLALYIAASTKDLAEKNFLFQ